MKRERVKGREGLKRGGGVLREGGSKGGGEVGQMEEGLKGV